MSKEEQQAMKTCFDQLHLRFDANRLRNRGRQYLPCSFHVNTRQIWQILDFFLNCFRILPGKHMVSLLRKEHGLQARVGFNNIMHAVHEY